MGNQELAGYITGPHSAQGQIHDPTTNAVRQRAPIHKHSTQLVDTGLTWKDQKRYF